MVFDVHTQERLREIAKKKKIGQKDIEFLKEVAKKHMELGTSVQHAAKDAFGDAVENVLHSMEMELWQAQRRRDLAQRDELDLGGTIFEFKEKHGIYPGEVAYHATLIKDIDKLAEALGTDKEIMSEALKLARNYEEAKKEADAAREHLEKKVEMLKELFKEAPIMYHVYVIRRGGKEGVHHLLRETYERAFLELAEELKEKIKKIAGELEESHK